MKVLKKYGRIMRVLTLFGIGIILIFDPEEAFAWSSGSHGGSGFHGGGFHGGRSYGGGFHGGSGTGHSYYGGYLDTGIDGWIILGVVVIFMSIILWKKVTLLVATFRSGEDYTFSENLQRFWKRVKPGDYMTYKGQLWQDRYTMHTQKLHQKTTKTYRNGKKKG